MSLFLVLQWRAAEFLSEWLTTVMQKHGNKVSLSCTLIYHIFRFMSSYRRMDSWSGKQAINQSLLVRGGQYQFLFKSFRLSFIFLISPCIWSENTRWPFLCLPVLSAHCQTLHIRRVQLTVFWRFDSDCLDSNSGRKIIMKIEGKRKE